MERRELERERERERERLLHQQRIAESNKQAAALAARDRSPLRNGTDVGVGEVRVKEEPRQPKEEDILLGRADHRYHNYLNRLVIIIFTKRQLFTKHTATVTF